MTYSRERKPVERSVASEHLDSAPQATVEQLITALVEAAPSAWRMDLEAVLDARAGDLRSRGMSELQITEDLIFQVASVPTDCEKGVDCPVAAKASAFPVMSELAIAPESPIAAWALTRSEVAKRRQRLVA